MRLFSNRCALATSVLIHTGGWGGYAALLRLSVGGLYDSGINVSTLCTDLVEEFTDPPALLAILVAAAAGDAPSFIAIILLYMDETAGVVGEAALAVSGVEATETVPVSVVIGVALRAGEAGSCAAEAASMLTITALPTSVSLSTVLGKVIPSSRLLSSVATVSGTAEPGVAVEPELSLVLGTSLTASSEIASTVLPIVEPTSLASSTFNYNHQYAEISS